MNYSLAFNFLDKSKLPSSKTVKESIVTRLSVLGIEGIEVLDVDVDIDGDILVTFEDEDGDEMDVVFTIDPDDGAIAIIQDDDEDFEDTLIVDLDGLAPSVIDTAFGQYIDLINSEWLNKSALLTILQAGLDDDDDSEEEDDNTNPDPYGYITTDEKFEYDEVITEERKVYVVRGGKKVKVAVVRKRRRKVLTGKQKAAIKKGARKRKAKKAIISRKRKKSLRLRKRLKIKKPKLSSRQKVAGTANRKR